MTSIITHTTHELITDQILTRGFKTFKELNIKFDENQLKLLKGYLQILLNNNESVLKEEKEQVLAKNEEFQVYADILLDKALNLTISLTTTSFINWGLALYYKFMVDNEGIKNGK